jgi:hypothetical protein
METFSVLIGFLIGVVATMIAVEFGLKKIFRPPAMNKVTASWRLDDHKAPLVVAQDAKGVQLPTGSKVVTAGEVDPLGFRDRSNRRNPNARSNFLVDPEMDRALVFMGPIREGTLALATLDPAVAARLRAEHKRLWETGEPYVEEVPFSTLGKKMGMMARLRGRVLECIAYKEHHLLRLSDGEQTVGVVVDHPLDLTGKRVVVTGRVVRGASGYPLVDADEVRLEGAPRTAPPEAPTPVAPPTSVPQQPPETSPHTPQQVLRIPRRAPSPPTPEPEEAPAAPQKPLLEAEPSEEATTEAERRRARARVVMHR